LPVPIDVKHAMPVFIPRCITAYIFVAVLVNKYRCRLEHHV
jgi:hypothetical protein